MRDIVAKYNIELLLKFALKNKMIEEIDVIPVRNSLLDLLKISEPYAESFRDEGPKSVNEILEGILDYASQAGIICEDTAANRDLLDARIMGLLMPRESEVARNFWKTVNAEGIRKATDDFYALSIASNYIRLDRTSKNVMWKVKTCFGDIEITINLSKPEKDPRDIARARTMQQTNYPKCLLCLENVGFSGHINHPARQNHRVIPVKLIEEQWYLQYSPYVYYNEHCILFYEKHQPMRISGKTFVRLFEFIEKFPHYFIGSNADIPIVGGSILSHEHFQGGRHIFPMELAEVERVYKHPYFHEINIGIIKWPMSVIRLSGMNKNMLVEIVSDILDKWRNYSDEKVDILSHTKGKGEMISHNTITPIARKNRRGEFEMDLVLRNNRTTTSHPEGIFHPHRELHHIKKENIGLIEVMGLAVLPPRLKAEIKVVQDILEGKTEYFDGMYTEESCMYKHTSFIEYLKDKYGTNMQEAEADEIMRYEIGQKFIEVLLTCGVFKRDGKGRDAFNRFMNYAGFSEINN